MAIGEKRPAVMEADLAIPGGVATLNAGGKLLESQRPSFAELGGSNPNLLLNWDFRKPVNRNGKTEYTKAGYTVDRWRLSCSTNCFVSIHENALVMNLGTTGQAISQEVSSPQAYAGKTVTLSLLVGAGEAARINIVVDGEAVGRSPYIADGLTFLTVRLPDTLSDSLRVLINPKSANTDTRLMAAKLELGPDQTLARQNANEEWEIIDPSDYDLQYILCSQYSSNTGEFIGSQHSNPNLLINWDFRNPINRNGKTEYTAAGVTIDRWRKSISLGVINIVEQGVQITASESATLTFFSSLDIPYRFLSGKTMTLSLLRTDNQLFTCTAKFPESAPSKNTDIAATPTSSDMRVFLQWNVDDMTLHVNINKYAAQNPVVTYVAAKLEFGDHQTLARQNGAGEWEIIDPPNYDLQYALCSLYSPTTGKWTGSQHSNPNLLDNWYFADPVNQRGQTTYTGLIYTIDRWTNLVPGTTFTVADGFCTVTGSDDGVIAQRLEMPFKVIAGKTFTASLLDRAGELHVVTGTVPAAKPTTNIVIATKDFTGKFFRFRYDGSNAAKGLYVAIGAGVNNSWDIIAAKLELGPVQTLAHQDADGNWVLNDPPPNQALELAKCQRYYESGIEIFTISIPGQSSYEDTIPFKVTKRATPACTIISKNGVPGNVSVWKNLIWNDIPVKQVSPTMFGVRVVVSNTEALSSGCVISFLVTVDSNL